MPSDGTGVGWDVTIPTDSGEVSDTGLEIREVKLAVAQRVGKEHATFAGSLVGGEHLPGSAFGYYQNSYPTLRPDGVTTLVTADAGRLLVRSDGPWLEVFDGANFQKVVPASASVTPDHVVSGFMDQALAYAIYTNQLDAATTTETVGTFNSGSWQTRILNTEVFDVQSIGSLASNQITLPAGTYRVRFRAPAFQVNYHQARFRNATDSVTIALGTMALSGSGDNCVTESIGEMEWTIGSTKAYQLEHRCSDSKATVGFGVGPGTFGVAWRTSVVEIWKLK